MRSIRAHLTFANVMSVAAVFIALGGSAIAINKIKANSVGSKQIKTGGVQNTDLADNSVTSPKVANGSLLEEDFKAGQLPAGAQGPAGQQGAQGATGPSGAQGIQGPPGSPDTPAQILAKLTTVDGSGSGLSADQLDGLTSSDFMLNGTDPVHVVGSGGEPPFLNSFTSAPVHGEAGFFRDRFGVVQLQGNIKLPSATPTGGAFALPAGYRPAAGRLYVAFVMGQPGSIPKVPEGVLVDPSSGQVGVIAVGGGSFATDDEVHLDGITFRCAPSGADGCP